MWEPCYTMAYPEITQHWGGVMFNIPLGDGRGDAPSVRLLLFIALNCNLHEVLPTIWAIIFVYLFYWYFFWYPPMLDTPLNMVLKRVSVHKIYISFNYCTIIWIANYFNVKNDSRNTPMHTSMWLKSITNARWFSKNRLKQVNYFCVNKMSWLYLKCYSRCNVCTL